MGGIQTRRADFENEAKITFTFMACDNPISPGEYCSDYSLMPYSAIYRASETSSIHVIPSPTKDNP
jgi:hypothetical protein